MKNTIKRAIIILVTIMATVNTFSQNAELKAIYANLPFKMEELKPIDFPKNQVKITDFGAVGNGIFDNTDAFAKAIDAVAAKGGGTVVVPMGQWVTGPIVFKSNINLHVEKGALISFTKDKSKYPIVKANFEGWETRRCMSPLNAHNLKNIAITGEGVLDGGGDAWRSVDKNKMSEPQWKELLASGGVLSDDGKTWFPSESYKKAQPLIIDQNVPKVSTEEQWLEIKDFLRPVMLDFVSCENIILDGVTFQNSPAWCLHPFMSTNVQVLNVTVRNPWYAKNGDGIDLESCKNTLIYNSSFDAGDDGICIKSGKDADGRKRAMPTENLIVYKCVVYHGHGGFVVGSEMSSGVKNIFVDNCIFLGTDAGLRFKSKRGRGGVVENIYISNIQMKDIETDAIIFDLYYGGGHGMAAVENEKNQVRDFQPVTEETPAFRNIYIKNITCNGAYRAFFFNGLPEMNVQNINIDNVAITSTNGATLNESDGINMHNITINASKAPMLTLYNVKNVVIDNFSSSSPQNDVMKVDGTNTNSILIKNCKFKEGNIQSSLPSSVIKKE